MKKILTVIAVLAISFSASAKFVKFAVNLDTIYTNGVPVSSNGVHIVGDFQVAAGYVSDWDPTTTLMTQDSVNHFVYSVVVNVPAFAKYEFQFINGDGFYGVEDAIPLECRVNMTSNNHRWLYVDSLANDTTFVGVIPFNRNAPEGLTLVRFVVDMTGWTISPNGVHVAGDFQGWNTATTRMYSFNDTLFECIAYVNTGNYEFKYVNGNTSSEYEVLSAQCTNVSGNRTVTVISDIVLLPAPFNACLEGIEENLLAKNISVYPNPTNSFSEIKFNDNSSYHSVSVSDITGRIVRRYDATTNFLRFEKDFLSEGIYLLNIKNKEEQEATVKLIVE